MSRKSGYYKKCNNDQINPPREWKNFAELKFRVSNFNPSATISDIKDAFTTYCNVYRVKIEEVNSENLIACIIIKPLPAYAFWNRKVRFHGRILQLDYQDDTSSSNSDTFTDYNTVGNRKSKFLSAESLEMGDYSLPGVFVSEAKFTQSVEFFINYQTRKIIVEFGLDQHTLKLEINFKDIINDIHSELDASQQTSRGFITIESKYPATYWVLKKKSSKYDVNWCIDDSWNRITEIHTKIKKGGVRYYKDNEEPGKWLVFRITFDLDQIGRNSIEGLGRFKELIENAAEYNLAPRNSNIRNCSLKIVRGPGLRSNHFRTRTLLTFEVDYMVECNISFNYLNEYNLCDEFFSLLSQQPTRVSLDILEGIYSRKKRIYNPLTYLLSELENFKYKLDNGAKYIPYYCDMVHEVVITSTTYYVLPPTMEISNRVIRQFRNTENQFLRVQFVDEALSKIKSSLSDSDTSNDALYNRVYRALRDGINIGNRHYEFLAFSSSQLRDHSCWFFSSTSSLTADMVRGWMGNFSTIKSVSKYAARMGQCFSSTRAIQKLPINDIKVIPDIVRNGFNFSDGAGNISFSLARKIARDLDLNTIPSAFQFRMAGYKGVLCQSAHVKNNKLQVRPSQHKFESNHNELEVVRSSTFISAYLNRQAITLLSALGIPDEVFIDLKDLRVRELDKMLESEHTALEVLQRNVDEYGISTSLADLVKAGFLRNNDHYLMNLISLFRIMMLRDIKKKAKIRIDKGAFLLGVLDVTDTLQENQIYCCISDPGDIRIVTAVKCKALSHLVDVIVFPSLGYRDIPSECSGGNLDGDDFTIIYDERLIPIKAYEPMNINQNRKPRMLENEDENEDEIQSVTIEDIKKFFVNYLFSDKLELIANAHLAKADSSDVGALNGKCIRLAQLHSGAVDYPKTGTPPVFPPELRADEFPDFMEKSDKKSYKSNKVLGILYRSINVSEEYTPLNVKNFDKRLYADGFEEFLDDARKLKREYDANIRGLMNQFGINNEIEVTSGYIVNTITNIDKKKPRDVTKSVMEALIPIKRHYKKLFDQEWESNKDHSRVESKASAWYFVTYHPSELDVDPSKRMFSFPWIAYDVLCGIANRNSRKIHVSMELMDFFGPCNSKCSYNLDEGQDLISWL
ncbi:4924_t:CDS:2 [Rhizophagus irregularis]|nr:4924_t:CDS:2 [Rhizophagus irregularis]